MDTEHTRDLDPLYYVNANGELVKIPSFTEEFYNQCHDEGGKFCGGNSVRGNSKSGKKDIDKKSRENAIDEVKRFAELFIGLPGKSSLKANRFGKKRLSGFSSAELCRFHSQFESDAKNLKTARKTAYLGIATIPLNTNRIFIAAVSATRSSIVIGFTIWRNIQIKKQLDRIDNFVAKRKRPGARTILGKKRAAISTKLELEELVEFVMASTERESSLIEEIKKAQKQIDEGKIEKVESPTRRELLDAQQYVNALAVDPEEGISQIIIDALRATVEEALKNTKNYS